MKTITRWIFIETEKDGSEWTSGSHLTKKLCSKHYKSLCADGKAFGTPGAKVEYIKLTGTTR